jgi:hypothetical protein
MRARPIIIAKQNIEIVPNLTEQEKEIILKQAMEISARINMVSTDGLQIMSSLDGAAYMTYLGLRKKPSRIDHQANSCYAHGQPYSRSCYGSFRGTE